MTLAAKEGIWPEASSVAPFAAIERLRAQGTIAPHERCVALLTASGLKDPGPIEKALPEPPLVSGGLPELMGALQEQLTASRMAELGISMDGRAPIADIPAQAQGGGGGRRLDAVDRLPSLPARSRSPWRRWRSAPPGASRSR